MQHASALSQPACLSPGRLAAAHHSSPLVERQAVLVGIGERGGEACWLPGRVTELSCEGCSLVIAAPEMPVGETARIMFPGFGAHAARILRAEEGQANAVFEPPLHPAIVDYILRMSDPAARG